MPGETEAFEAPSEVSEAKAPAEAAPPGLSDRGRRAMQGPADDAAAAGSPAPASGTGHLVPANVDECIDRARAVNNAEDIAASEYPHKAVSELPARSVQGLAFEGMTQDALADSAGAENITVHPQGEQLRDGRPIEPDLAVQDSGSTARVLVDAKGYHLKDAHSPNAAASSLTHMQNLEHAARYTDANDKSVQGVVFAMPRETADQPAVQEAVAKLGTDERPVAVMAVGDETAMKQTAEELALNPADRGQLPDGFVAEVDRIATLPLAERREAMGQLMLSQRDERGNWGLMAAYLQDHGEIERNGDGITILDNAGQKHTVWYRPQPEK